MRDVAFRWGLCLLLVLCFGEAFGQRGFRQRPGYNNQPRYTQPQPGAIVPSSQPSNRVQPAAQPANQPQPAPKAAVQPQPKSKPQSYTLCKGCTVLYQGADEHMYEKIERVVNGQKVGEFQTLTLNSQTANLQGGTQVPSEMAKTELANYYGSDPKISFVLPLRLQYLAREIKRCKEPDKVLEKLAGTFVAQLTAQPNDEKAKQLLVVLRGNLVEEKKPVFEEKLKAAEMKLVAANLDRMIQTNLDELLKDPASKQFSDAVKRMAEMSNGKIHLDRVAQKVAAKLASNANDPVAKKTLEVVQAQLPEAQKKPFADRCQAELVKAYFADLDETLKHPTTRVKLLVGNLEAFSKPDEVVAAIATKLPAFYVEQQKNLNIIKRWTTLLSGAPETFLTKLQAELAKKNKKLLRETGGGNFQVCSIGGGYPHLASRGTIFFEVLGDGTIKKVNIKNPAQHGEEAMAELYSWYCADLARVMASTDSMQFVATQHPDEDPAQNGNSVLHAVVTQLKDKRKEAPYDAGVAQTWGVFQASLKAKPKAWFDTQMQEGEYCLLTNGAGKKGLFRERAGYSKLVYQDGIYSERVDSRAVGFTKPFKGNTPEGLSQMAAYAADHLNSFLEQAIIVDIMVAGIPHHENSTTVLAKVTNELKNRRKADREDEWVIRYWRAFKKGLPAELLSAFEKGVGEGRYVLYQLSGTSTDKIFVLVPGYDQLVMRDDELYEVMDLNKVQLIAHGGEKLQESTKDQLTDYYCENADYAFKQEARLDFVANEVTRVQNPKACVERMGIRIRRLVASNPFDDLSGRLWGTFRDELPEDQAAHFDKLLNESEYRLLTSGSMRSIYRLDHDFPRLATQDGTLSGVVVGGTVKAIDWANPGLDDESLAHLAGLVCEDTSQIWEDSSKQLFLASNLHRTSNPSACLKEVVRHLRSLLEKEAFNVGAKAMWITFHNALEGPLDEELSAALSQAGFWLYTYADNGELEVFVKELSTHLVLWGKDSYCEFLGDDRAQRFQFEKVKGTPLGKDRSPHAQAIADLIDILLEQDIDTIPLTRGQLFKLVPFYGYIARMRLELKEKAFEELAKGVVRIHEMDRAAGDAGYGYAVILLEEIREIFPITDKLALERWVTYATMAKGPEPNGCDVVCKLLDNEKLWRFTKTDHHLADSGPNSYKMAIRTLQTLFIVKAASYCHGKHNGIMKEALSVWEKDLNILKSTATPTGDQATNPYKRYAKHFSMLIFRELNQNEAVRKQVGTALLEELNDSRNRVPDSGPGHSGGNTYEYATLLSGFQGPVPADSGEDEALQRLIARVEGHQWKFEQKNDLFYEYIMSYHINPAGGSRSRPKAESSVRASAGRVTPVYLVLYLLANPQKYLSKLLNAVALFETHAGSYGLHIERNGAHNPLWVRSDGEKTQFDGIPPYGYYPAIPYVMSAIRLLRRDLLMARSQVADPFELIGSWVKGENHFMMGNSFEDMFRSLDRAQFVLRRTLINKLTEDGLFRLLGRKNYPDSETWSAALAGIAMLTATDYCTDGQPVTTFGMLDHTVKATHRIP